MMTPEDMAEKKKMVLSMCICPSCPSWIDCDEKGGFCSPAIGKSSCITDEKGCICKKCPVYEKMALQHLYFCTKGSEKEQSGM
jgi:hypothetical protein